MPLAWRQEAFEERAGRFCLRQEFQAGVELPEQDIRRQPPAGAFHLVLCRNLAFTYFEENLQSEIARAIHDRLVPGGCSFSASRKSFLGPPAGLSNSFLTCGSTANGLFPRC
jgi:chemotaxis protein methyltransferase CheR